jgi:DNA-directed RNA polymerase subunit E'/Rpb7
VSTRRRVTVLTCIAALALGLGILLFSVFLRPSTELIEGTVVAVAPVQLSVVVHARSGAAELRGHNVIVHLAPGQKVRTSLGEEDLRLLRAGQRVRVRVRHGSYDAKQIWVSGPSGPSATSG